VAVPHSCSSSRSVWSGSPILLSTGVAIAGLSFCLLTISKGDVVQFATLPQVVQTTVIRETRIPTPASVIRVVQEPEGMYEVVVQTDTGEQTIYVSTEGTIVRRPRTAVREEGSEGGETFVTIEEIERGGSRYEVVDRDQGIYIDRQTNRRVRIRREGSEEEQGTIKKEERSGGEVDESKQRNERDGRNFRNETRTKEESNSVGEQNGRDEGNVTTKEKEGKSGVGKGDRRNEKRNTRDLNDERQETPKGEGNLRNDERNGNEGSKVGQGDQGNERKDSRDLSKSKQQAPKGEGNVTNDERNKAHVNKNDQRSPRPEGNMTDEGNKGERTQEGVNQTRKQNEPATQKPGGEEKERTTGKERGSPTP
jgi:hypothetical protein